ncbi:DUF3566 domain-containing protein [Monashia sp. NPDC004114]
MSTTSSDGPFGATGYGTSPALSSGSTSPSSTNSSSGASGSTGASRESTSGSSGSSDASGTAGSGDYTSNGAGYYGTNGSPYSSSGAGTGSSSSYSSGSGSSSGYSSSAYGTTGSTTPISTPGSTGTGSTSGAPDNGGTELSRGAVTTRTAPTARVSPGAGGAGAGGAHATAGSRTASTAAARKHRGPRRVRLAVARVDPWSVMKMSFLLSVALGIAGVVLTAVLWMILSTMNVFTDVEGVLQSLQTTTSDPFSIKDYVGFGRVVSLSIVIGVIDVILMTAIATVMAFLYNICSALVGGVQLTLTDD